MARPVRQAGQLGPPLTCIHKSILQSCAAVAASVGVAITILYANVLCAHGALCVVVRGTRVLRTGIRRRGMLTVRSAAAPAAVYVSRERQDCLLRFGAAVERKMLQLDACIGKLSVVGRAALCCVGESWSVCRVQLKMLPVQGLHGLSLHADALGLVLGLTSVCSLLSPLVADQ